VADLVGAGPLAFVQAENTWLVGTRTELVLVTTGEPTDDAGPEPSVTRIPWERVEGADWHRDDSRLRISEVGEFGRPRPSYEFAMPDAEPALLLQLIRERVTASVVLQRGQLIEGKRGLKVIGRRSPVGGPIAWMHEYDAGIDPDDPDVAAAADALLREARADVGEPADPI
jgi:hypothetical protein